MNKCKCFFLFKEYHGVNLQSMLILFGLMQKEERINKDLIIALRILI